MIKKQLQKEINDFWGSQVEKDLVEEFYSASAEGRMRAAAKNITDEKLKEEKIRKIDEWKKDRLSPVKKI
jgi:hypothetical protein